MPNLHIQTLKHVYANELYICQTQRKIMRKWILKFNFNESIGENGYENDYTTVGKQLKSYINSWFSV